MKAWLANGALAIAALALSFAVLEIGARAFLPAPTSVEIAPAAAEKGRQQRLTARIGSLLKPPRSPYRETATGRRLRPNLRFTVDPDPLCGCRVEIRSNAQGFRGPELGEKQRTRVLFLGDSITMADYAPEEETWVRRVQGLSEGAAAAGRGRLLETVNAGVPGIGLGNELAILLEEGLDVEPDVVVLGWYLNDAKASAGMRVLKPPPVLAWSRLVGHVSRRLSLLGVRDGFEAFSEAVDVMPTILAWLGADCPPQCDGESLMPLLAGEAPATWRSICAASPPRWRPAGQYRSPARRKWSAPPAA